MRNRPRSQLSCARLALSLPQQAIGARLGRAAIDIYRRWEVRSLRCYEEGLALQGIQLEHPSHPLAGDPARAVLVEVLAAAMCHATNWDRLRQHLISAACNANGSFTPAALARRDFAEYLAEFGAAFDDEVADLDRRYEMFRSVVEALSEPGYSVGSLHQRDVVQLAGPGGLYAQLDSLAPFAEDPQRKKSRLLVQHLVRFGLIRISDPDSLQPAIEYHLIRLYMRTGRVAHSEAKDVGATTSSTDIRSVNALREAVEQAMHYTAYAAELSVADLNEIEWQVARSFCTRNSPRCEGPPLAAKPVSQSILERSQGACPFSGSCDGPRHGRVALTVEPKLSSRHAFY